MALELSQAQARSILTRTGGFLRTVTSHSLQPYRGCAYGSALCGVGCYVRHNGLLTRGQPWGSFLEARVNAAEIYAQQYQGERRWARRRQGRFAVFLSSSTDPFVPQEPRLGVTRGVLEAMVKLPPDALVLQTHSHLVVEYLDLYPELAARCDLRVHLSIESDREGLPGLPPPASPLDRRFHAAARLREAGVRVVITVAPLLPVADPDGFFERIAQCADAVVIDHYIQGDGSADGGRTARTGLPAAMAAVDPEALRLDYRERMVAVARRHLPGRVGVHVDGFAGRFLPA